MSDFMEIGEFMADKDGWFYHTASGQKVRLDETGALINELGEIVASAKDEYLDIDEDEYRDQ